MQLERFDDLAAFRRRAEPFLVAREAEHNLLLGMTSALGSAAEHDPGLDYLAVVVDDGVVVAVAGQTPPFGLVLSEIDRIEAIDLLLDDVEAIGPPSVLGPAEHAGGFARRLAERFGFIAVHESSQRIFRTTTIRPPVPAAGHLRAAAIADRDLLVEWLTAFEREALGDDDPIGVDELVAGRLERGWAFIWDDDGPVSFVGIGGRTPNGVLLEGGYTPPGLRGHGYGGNAVAAISRSLLEDGALFVFLFTDLANPVSNHIYQALGYEPVRDVEVWRLEAR